MFSYPLFAFFHWTYHPVRILFGFAGGYAVPTQYRSYSAGDKFESVDQTECIVSCSKCWHECELVVSICIICHF